MYYLIIDAKKDKNLNKYSNDLQLGLNYMKGVSSHSPNNCDLRKVMTTKGSY